MVHIASVDNAAPATAGERARQRFVSTLRSKILNDLARDMRDIYETKIAPGLAAETEDEDADGIDSVRIRRRLSKTDIYRFYSSSRYKAQEMTWESVRPQVERNLSTLNQMGRDAAGDGVGTLRLDPSLEIPRYVSKMDVHLMPGCFHSEYTDDDISQGAIFTYGVGVFYGGLPKTSDGGGPGKTIAKFIRAAYPEFRPEKILDLGCSTGSGTFPYVDEFPEAEVYGVDVGAPMLRYAHARAEAAGKRVHFSQQNAESLDFEDNSFDVVTSSYLLHELPVRATQKILKEIHRILKPGGLMIHFELAPQSEVDPYLDFYYNWDAYANNEPYYAQFRRQNLRALCEKAGFPPENYIQNLLFNWGTVPEEKFEACARGEIKTGIILNGGTWFTFGARKEAAA